MSLQATVASQGVRAKLATLLFLIALLLGNGALIGGLEKDGGTFFAGLFAVACVLWWISFRISLLTVQERRQVPISVKQDLVETRFAKDAGTTV
jgi:hypothetical protein